MQESVAIKLAEHLGHIAATARIKRALDAYMQKKAKGDFDFLYGGGGGALLGALAGGGSTAVANLFRKKQDRKSILNNALMGGLGGGALGLGATSIYKAMNDPSKVPPKNVDDIAAKIKKKDDSAYKDTDKTLNASGFDYITDYTGIPADKETFKILSAAGLGTAGYRRGSVADTQRALDNAYRNNTKFQETVDRLTGGNDLGRRQALFNNVAKSRVNFQNPMWFAFTPDRKMERVDAAQLRRQGFSDSVGAGKGRPMLGRIGGTVAGFGLPYLVDQGIQMLGLTPTQILTGEDQFRRRAGLTQYAAEQEAARAARGQ